MALICGYLALLVRDTVILRRACVALAQAWGIDLVEKNVDNHAGD